MILEGGAGPVPPGPQADDPLQRAGEILGARGLAGARLTLLEEKKNVTFRVDGEPGSAGGRYLLRLCDPAGYSPDEIASEAVWLQALREEGRVAAPEPVAAPDGSFVAVGSGRARHGILFRWIAGVTLDNSISPEMLVRLGELLGRMHDFGGRFVPPSGFTRPRYDTARILGDPEVLPADWDGPLLTRRDRSLLAEAARAVRADLEGLREDSGIFGMIHTDPEPDNMVERDGELYPIDFADCGRGYYLYDLAAALLPLGEKRNLAELRHALLEGYLRTHPLPPGHVDLLDTFLIVRGLFAVRWMLVEGWWREAVRAYASTAVPHILAEVRRYLDGRTGGGAAPGAGAPALARLNTVRFLTHLRGLGIQLAAEGERLRLRAPKGALTAGLQEEITARKPEILAALRRGAAAAGVPPLVRVSSAAGVGHPLSYSQRQIWFLDQLEPGNPSYNIPQAVQMTGSLRHALLEASLGEVVRRQASLRTTFASGPEEPVQLVAPRLDVPIPVIDLRALPAAAREGEGARLTRDEARRPFDLAAGPLLRFTLLRLADEEHRALVTAHHIVSDGQSGGVLIRELATVYEAALRGEPSPLPEPPIQYTDYAHWQRQWLQGERLVGRLAYWREQLQEMPAVFDLPFDRPRLSQPTSRGGRLDVEIPSGLTARLSEMGRARDATLFMVLLAGFSLLLARLSGRSDVVVGSPVANRARVETEGLVGFFVNTLVLRIAVDGAATFDALLEGVRRITQEAYAHQDLPFEKLVEELRPERSLSHTPLFQILFNFQSVLLPELRLGGLLLRWLPAQGGVEKFDLSLGLRETREGVAIALSYKRDLFDATTIARLAGQYLSLLDHATSNPDRPIYDLPLFSAAERQQLVEWNDTAEVFAGEPCLHELILAQVAQTPGALAVVAEDAAITYRELARRSGWLSAHLRRMGVGPDVLVGLCVERSVEMVVGILGILRAGGAYVPLDPAYPPARLQFMLEDAGASVLLTTRKLVGGLPADGPTVVRLDEAGWDGGGEAPEAEPWKRPGPGNLAYVIYTSGSTGQPKGAMNTHEAVRNRLLWTQQTFGLTPRDRILQKTPFSFDVSVWELLWPLMVGARLVMAKPGGHLDPVYLIDLIALEGITTLHFVPPMLGVFLEQEGLESCRTLQRVLASGEALPVELERRFYERLGWAGLFNLYGPTEAAIDVSWWPCAPRGERTSVPIGRPVANVRLAVLDAGARPVLLGVAGELHIGGIALARGYWRRPSLTAERFVPDPVSGEAGARLYRTGDLARFRPGGEIEYLGRIDHQVKVRGFRIEPAEIEAALAAHLEVRECLVLARRDATGDIRLVAYVVPAEGPSGAPRVGELREYLRTRLPAHMVPSAFVTLPAFPLTHNGKVDRKALPEPTHAVTETDSGAPITTTEEILAAIWAEVLDIERVGREDHFFERGGHSLRATQVVARLRETLGVALPVRRLFEAPTLAELAEAVDAERQAGGLPLAPVPRDSALPLSFAQQRLWFLDRLVPDSPAYNIPAAVRLAGALDPALLWRALAFLVRRHETLRTSFPAVDGEPAQVIAPDLDLPLPLVDLTSLSLAEREWEARRLARAEARRPFDLAAGPLVRLALLRLGNAEHVALLTMHHIVSDGWSLGVLLEELAGAYTACGQGVEPALPPLPVQYADFAVWQRRVLTGERLDAELAWWRSQLAGLPASLPLLTDHPRPAVPTWRGGAWRLALAPDVSAGLAALARRERATLFMTLLAGFGALLGRVTGAADLAVGSPVAGREWPQLERLIGFFVNTLVLRVELAENPEFRELLAAVRQTCLNAYTHQDLPFERLVEELAPARDLSHSPLFQVAFALQNAPRRSLALPGIAAAPLPQLPQDTAAAKFDLTLTLEERDGALAGALEYRADLFDQATVAHLAGALGCLLTAAVAAPGTRISALPLLDPLQRQQVLVEWSQTEPDPADLRPVHAQVAERALAEPGACALVSASGHLTYGELLASARRLAWHLRELGVGAESVVAVFLKRSMDEVVALLAVFEAGGAYLPLDPAHPRQRLAFQIADSGARVLISTEPLAAGLVPAPGSAPLSVVLLDREAASLAARPAGPLPEASGPANLAYVIYTSGSTGAPKGVAVDHLALSWLVGWHVQAFAVTPADRASRLAGLSFDGSVWELWPSLAAGATVAVPPDEIRISPTALRDWLLAEQVTICLVPTPMAEALLGLDWPPDTPLRRMLTGGDALHRYPPAGLPWRLVNNYGPTETTVVATYGPVPPDGPSGQAPSLGRPIAGARIYLLDGSLAPVPAGAPGEIFIGGAIVARGYLGRPDKTADCFIPDPLSSAPGARFYRSGDLARYRAGGTLEFLGRLDSQVKIRGFRIEPGEVAAILTAHPAVRESAVLPQEGPGGDLRLVAWVVAAGAEPPTERALRDYLRERLPAYMMPSAFGFLPALPLTPNGKLDRRALPRLEPAGATAGTWLAPRDLLELRLAQIWEELLGGDPVGLRDDFFERGGHSLLALRLVAEIRSRLGRELPLASLFGGATVERVAAALRAMGETEAPARREILVPIRSRGSRPPLFLVHPVGGNVLCYAGLARHLGPDQPIWGLQSPGPEERLRDLPALAASYVDVVRHVAPEGPRRLAGWSLGAAVAFEMARQLAESGRPVDRLILLDPPTPGIRTSDAPDAQTLMRLFARDLAGLAAGRPDALTADGDDPLAGLLAAARDNGVLPAEAGEEEIRERFALFHDNFLALHGYTPGPYAGRAVVFRAAGRAEETDPVPAWRGLITGGLEVEDIPGDHWSLLREPQVRSLAERLAARLEEET